MTLQNLHQAAEESTPAGINVPQTWGGILVWALGKWGIGVVFLAMLVPVYQDLKASNATMAEMSAANVRVLETLAAKVEASNAAISRLDDTVRRLESANSK